MRLRRALDDYKRHRGEARVFPGERRTTTGTFSGLDDRLVHVDADGALRDYSYPLTGLRGVERSRFGIETAGEVVWLDGAETRSQGYAGETALVETVHAVAGGRVVQRDLTLGRAHVTHFALDGVDGDASLQAFFGLAPDGQEGQVTRLHHDGAVEAYHDREHDYVAAGGDATATGQVQESLGELLADDPLTYPREVDRGRYEDSVTSGYVLLSAPFDGGTATVVSLLTDVTETPRAAALDRVDALRAEYDDAGALRDAAERQARALPSGLPDREVAVADLRVLALLSAENGARTAGPDMDPFYEHSGGYGYTWFRDDAEIARFLLAADDRLPVDLSAVHERSAAFHLETQQPDGSWPHRVWPHSGRLAPGWANARLERGGDGADYQADQTGSVIAFLARYLRTRDPANAGEIAAALDRAVGSLDETLGADGLPVTCQNAWENMTGRFAHTAATFLQAYAAVARAPVGDDLAAHAREQADRVVSGLDALWSPERECYGLRLHGGDLDDRYDSGALALAAAHREYAAAADLPASRLDRLVAHVTSVVEGLERETGAVRGLARFEGDDWRRGDQAAPKVWTVSTAWGANAAAQTGLLLADRGDDRAERFFALARDLHAEVAPGGSLVRPNGYLPEQVFDDGTPDCATPLGWPHALRFATVAALADADELDLA